MLASFGRFPRVGEGILSLEYLGEAPWAPILVAEVLAQEVDVLSVVLGPGEVPSPRHCSLSF